MNSTHEPAALPSCPVCGGTDFMLAGEFAGGPTSRALSSCCGCHVVFSRPAAAARQAPSAPADTTVPGATRAAQAKASGLTGRSGRRRMAASTQASPQAELDFGAMSLFTSLSDPRLLRDGARGPSHNRPSWGQTWVRVAGGAGNRLARGR